MRLNPDAFGLAIRPSKSVQPTLACYNQSIGGTLRYEQQLRIFALEQGHYRAIELTEPRYWFDELGLGLRVWDGRYQGVEGQWLRWYDAAGEWIPTNAERVTAAEAQARREAIPRLKALGLSAEQIAAALGLSVAEVGD